MNKYDFTSLVKDPDKLGSQDIESLKLLVAEFPYFSVGQNLLVKALYNTKHYDYDKFLKQAALQAGDRSVLYNLVHNLPAETESAARLNEVVGYMKTSEPVITESAVVFSEPIVSEVEKIEMQEAFDTNDSLKPEEIQLQHSSSQLPVVNEEITFTKSQESEPIEGLNGKEEIQPQEPPVNEYVQIENTQKNKPIVPLIPETKPTRLIIPEPEPDPETSVFFNKKSAQIDADEKLVESTGNFVRYIPKNPRVAASEKEESLVNSSSHTDDLILQNFDISSLQDLNIPEPVNLLTVKNISVEEDVVIPKENIVNDDQSASDVIKTKEIETVLPAVEIEMPLLEIPLVHNIELVCKNEFSGESEESPKQLISLENMLDVNSQESVLNEVKPVSLILNETPDKIQIPDPDLSILSVEKIKNDSEKVEVTQVADTDFFYWLSNKQITNDQSYKKPSLTNITFGSEQKEELPPSAESEVLKRQNTEDESFVAAFQSKLAEQSKNLLHNEIAGNLHINEEDLSLKVFDEPVYIDKTDAETDFIESPQSELNFDEENEEEFEAFDFFNKLKPQSSPIENELLRSLALYEVNEFLAPLYNKVIYNNQLFEDNFGSVFVETERSEPKPVSEIYNVNAAVIKVQKRKVNIEKEPVDMNAEKVIKPKLSDNLQPKIHRNPQIAESILDKFIRENPSIARPKSEFYSPLNMAKQSAEDNNEMVSETLAQIYTQQSLYKKAISMYQKLGLLYPDKLSYFAGLINQIKSAHNIE